MPIKKIERSLQGRRSESEMTTIIRRCRPVKASMWTIGRDCSSGERHPHADTWSAHYFVCMEYSRIDPPHPDPKRESGADDVASEAYVLLGVGRTIGRTVREPIASCCFFPIEYRARGQISSMPCTPYSSGWQGSEISFCAPYSVGSDDSRSLRRRPCCTRWEELRFSLNCR